MDILETYLRNFPNYTPQVLEEIQPYISLRKLEVGDFFHPAGHACRKIGFVEQGLLRIFYLNDGKEVTTCFCKEGTVATSYRSLITEQPSDVAIQAIEETRIWVLPYASLQQLYGKNMFWQQVGRIAAEQEFMETERHNRSIHDLSATERYLQFLETDRTLFHRIPLNYLASYLQIVPETLSRIRRKISQT